MSTDVIKSAPRPVVPESIYEKAKDFHVRKYIMYGHTDGKLYATADHRTVVERPRMCSTLPCTAPWLSSTAPTT